MLSTFQLCFVALLAYCDPNDAKAVLNIKTLCSDARSVPKTMLLSTVNRMMLFISGVLHYWTGFVHKKFQLVVDCTTHLLEVEVCQKVNVSVTLKQGLIG